jgi:hypothetical protein
MGTEAVAALRSQREIITVGFCGMITSAALAACVKAFVQ